MKNNRYKSFMALSAAGLACVVLLTGTPAPADPAVGDSGRTGPWIETSGEGTGDAEGGSGISPLGDFGVLGELPK